MEKNEVPAAKKQPNYRGIKVMPFVIGNETFEKLGTIGTSSNLLVYLTTVFNMKSITATLIVNIFNGTCNFGTLFGAFLCDTYLGRYKTLGIASVSSFLGMLVLTLTAPFSDLHPPACGTEANSTCVAASPGQLAFLFLGFLLLVMGASGIRPCNLAFGADQFNPESESGKRGINSFFNWYYFTFTFAMMLSLTVIVYVQSNVSWVVGLGIPTFLMFLSCAFFFVGTRMYVIVLPEGSPLTSMVQTIVVAFRNRKMELPQHPWSSLFNHLPPDSINSKLAYTDDLKFLSRAAVLKPSDKINPDGSAADPWKLRSVQQVEELKCVIRVVPIWIACLMYYMVIILMQTYAVFQALQTDRRFSSGSFKIPAASYNVFTMMSLTVWIPIYDRLVVPLLRRVTGKEGGFTMLQRMGIGILLGVLTMVVSGLVEHHRRSLALTRPMLHVVERKGAVSSMSGYWLVPQLALVGLSEAFTMIGQVEFYYKQFPENMRSFAGSFLFCGAALSSYLTSFLISVVHSVTGDGAAGNNWLAEDLNHGRLDYFYYLVGGIEMVNMGYFLVCSKWYKYKRIENESMDVALEKVDDHSKRLV